MIITIYGIIVFQLVERIAVAEKSMKSVLRKCSWMLGFSYNAIPTRDVALVVIVALCCPFAIFLPPFNKLLEENKDTVSGACCKKMVQHPTKNHATID